MLDLVSGLLSLNVDSHWIVCSLVLYSICKKTDLVCMNMYMLVKFLAFMATCHIPFAFPDTVSFDEQVWMISETQGLHNLEEKYTFLGHVLVLLWSKRYRNGFNNILKDLNPGFAFFFPLVDCGFTLFYVGFRGTIWWNALTYDFSCVRHLAL